MGHTGREGLVVEVTEVEVVEATEIVVAWLVDWDIRTVELGMQF